MQRGVKTVYRKGEGNKGGKENGMEGKGEGERKEKGKGNGVKGREGHGKVKGMGRGRMRREREGKIVLKEGNGRKDCTNRKMY